jgi:hypothetical protein
MNTLTQDLAVTIGLIAGISKAFRFEAVTQITEGEPQFTCDMTDNVDKTFVPHRECYDFYFTDRKNRDKGNLHIVLRTEEGEYGNRYYLSVYDNPVTEASHQYITYAAFNMVRVLLIDIAMEVSLSWVGR